MYLKLLSRSYLLVFGIWSTLLPLTMILCTASAARSKPDLLQRQFSAVTTHRNVRDIMSCRVNCTGVRARAVCGTDGNTYPHRCAVKRLRVCEKLSIRVAHRRPCRHASTGLAASARSALRPSVAEGGASTAAVLQPSRAASPSAATDGGGGGGAASSASGRRRPGSRCTTERRQAQDTAKRTASGVYVPKCRPDGSYAKVQCHQATGYCWCATGDGKPIPGSSVRGNKIKCKGTKGRKAPQHHRKRARKPKGCNPTQRSTFNRNLISLFSEEFERVPKPTPPSYPGAPKDLPIKSESDAILDTPEKRVIEWKFSELDINKDNKLRRKEIQGLRRLVKKNVPPRACARNFDQYCDLDQDGRIERSEWSVCLGVDINKDRQSTATPTLTEGGSIPLRSHDVTPVHDVTDVIPSASIFLRSPVDAVGTGTNGEEEEEDGTPSLWNKQRTSLLNPGGSHLSIGSTEAQETQMPSTGRDCPEERAAALTMDRMDPAGRIFIPECIADKFKREQCHTSTGYCWCVDETTGKPIPGTSTHNVLPDCTNTQGREFKGCPYPQKKKFLIELIDQLTDEISEYATNSTDESHMPEPDPNHSLEERAVRWKLRRLDKNRNGALERRELKLFKREIRKRKTLRKCSRNFIKYCDTNNDKSITMTEWVDCMGLNDRSVAEQQRNLPVNPKRRGPNPFRKYLRS